MIVLAWTVLLLFLGMSIDYGIVLRYRRAMQNACDAGVMSGGLDLKTNPGVVASKTISYASNDMRQNNIQYDGLTAETLDANGNPTGTNPVQDRAHVHATVPTYFYRLVVPSVPVAIECTSRIVPATKTGLRPLGMDFSNSNGTGFYQIWTNGCTPAQPGGLCQTPCPLIGQPIPASQQSFCKDYSLTVGINSSLWGSGNTGTLSMSNPTACGTSQGASNFACVMTSGTGSTPSSSTPPPPYCANKVVLNSNPPAGVTPWPACSIVSTKPGVTTGNDQSTNPTGISGGVAAICATPNPLNADGTINTASKWIVVLPLLDASVWGNTSVNGKSESIDIVGFTAFELDCPAMGYGSSLKGAGNTATIQGRFVSLLDTQATAGCIPTPQNSSTCVDTGVETLILVE